MDAPIVVAGNLSLDDVVTPDGQFPRSPGGDALYASLGIRAWGPTPMLLTLVGDDYPSEHLARMVAAGIDVSHVRATTGPTVHYTVTYEPDGSRRFEWISAEERLALTSPVAADYSMLGGAAWLHLAAMPIEAQETGWAAARALGVPTSLDPHEEYIVGFEDRVARMVDGVVFCPSELEARLLFPDLDIEDPVAFATAAAERLDAWHPAAVAVKVGALGSVVRRDGRTRHIEAAPAEVVDPTGAGDAYCGGFVAGWLQSRSVAVAAACGAVAAAETIGVSGAFAEGPGPTREARLAAVAALVARSDDDDRAATEAALTRLAAAQGASS